MCDRNVKSGYILIELCALVLNISVKEIPNFMRKYCLIAELLIFNTDVPMTKYLCFQYSVDYCSHLSLVNSQRKHGIFRRRWYFN